MKVDTKPKLKSIEGWGWKKSEFRVKCETIFEIEKHQL
jgi:hypothetical protein